AGHPAPNTADHRLEMRGSARSPVRSPAAAQARATARQSAAAAFPRWRRANCRRRRDNRFRPPTALLLPPNHPFREATFAKSCGFGEGETITMKQSGAERTAVRMRNPVLEEAWERSPADPTGPRFIIEDIFPCVDGGRYPIKRIAGESVEVWADIFREGHDV